MSEPYRDKTYTVERLASGKVRATVTETTVDEAGTIHETTYPLRHLVYHSPSGLEFGYAGSGPADLARSITGDLLTTTSPEPQDYQRVKEFFIATIEGDGPIEITGASIRALIRPGGCC